MKPITTRRLPEKWLEQAVTWLVLGVVLFYSFMFFYHIPYLGFAVNMSSGEVVQVFVETSAAESVRVSDRLLAVGELTWPDIAGSLTKPLTGELSRGDALPLFPLSYLYTVYHHRSGGFELRTNRIVALYVYTLLNTLLVVVILVGLSDWVGLTERVMAAGVVVATVSGLLAAIGYPRFQRLVERHLLQIPMASTDLLESYAMQITSTLDRERLSAFLRESVLPTLLIRQSALLSFDSAWRTDILYAEGVRREQLPIGDEIPALLTTTGAFRPPALSEPTKCQWVRLALPLQAGSDTIGLWLLGRRDPDDIYTRQDIPTLQAIVNQVAHSEHRYPRSVEQHLFRIIQQAMENSLQHALAGRIEIQGELGADHVALRVVDDDRGLELGRQRLDLNRLLVEKHFGLVGMYERAAVIDARLEINSAPGAGTTIGVIWRAQPNDERGARDLGRI